MRWFKDAPDHWRSNLRGGHVFTIWEGKANWVYEYWPPVTEESDQDEPEMVGSAPTLRAAKDAALLTARIKGLVP